MSYMGKNGAIVGGEILFEGRDMRAMSQENYDRSAAPRSRWSTRSHGIAQSVDEDCEQLAEVAVFTIGVPRHEGARPRRKC